MRVILALLVGMFLVVQSDAQQQANMYGTWSDPTLVGSSAYNNTYNEIWGLAVNGREFAVIGSTKGTHFIDVTDTSMNQVAFVPGGQQGPVVIHRDYHDLNGYLYAVCDEGGNSTLQIIDITTLPDSVSVVYDSNNLLTQAHNIFIDSSTSKLYACAALYSGGYSPLLIYDISTPAAPTLLGSYNSFGGNGIGHVHDMYVEKDTAYLNCGYDGFYIVEFSDVNNPQMLGALTSYAQQGYNHSGWRTADGNYYVMADENHNKDMKMLEVADPSDIEVKKLFNADATSAFTIPHNQLIKGDTLFVSYYYDGLQVYDISDPLNPSRIYYYDTYPGVHNNSYEGAWGVYPYLPSGKILISDMQTGLYVVSLGSLTNTTSFEPIDLQAKAYPQPFDDNFFLKIESPLSDMVNISLIDISGRSVWSQPAFDLQKGTNRISIDGSSLSSGVYFVHISGKAFNTSLKVIKR